MLNVMPPRYQEPPKPVPFTPTRVTAFLLSRGWALHYAADGEELFCAVIDGTPAYAAWVEAVTYEMALPFLALENV